MVTALIDPAIAVQPPALPTVEQVWDWLAEVEDPEIPVISIVDLGIVRDVAFDGAACMVTITPTYSGCPATEVIAQSIMQALQARGLNDVRLKTRIAPAWTTDWISEDGRRKLRGYGIAPPMGSAAEQTIRPDQIGRGAPRQRSPLDVPIGLACPHCGSQKVRLTSPFGSTPCKALARCDDCLEPFDYFKCH
ncbi:MAG TPA: 1,2-phenylacetyl-CoA epoxidase subunit PaaD [Burkholderiaceae bacterium]|nr:1,2-phenylacetyl-CoA epoxidase subunit PaaD [Burkholderiaceae bacterium]